MNVRWRFHGREGCRDSGRPDRGGAILKKSFIGKGMLPPPTRLWGWGYPVPMGQNSCNQTPFRPFIGVKVQKWSLPCVWKEVTS